MDIRELFKLALSSLRANKLRSALTTLGIIIGVFSVIMLVALGNGLQKYITDQISGLGSNLMFVVPGKIGQGGGPGDFANKLTIADAKYLAGRIQSIANVSPLIQKNTTVKYGNKSNKNTNIWGATASFPLIVKTELEKGTFFTETQANSGSRVALIGPTVKSNLFPNEEALGKRITISGGKYTIIGITKKKGSVFGQDQDNVIIIPVDTAKKQFNVSTVNAIYISAKQPGLVSLVKRRSETILLTRFEEDDFTVMTQEQTLSTVTSITSILTTALGGIAAISLLVGGIGVMNIMLVSVTERTKEIGLRKALGARRNDILSQFLLEAVMLSLLGGLIGVVLGWGASLVIARFFVAEVTLWSVLLAFGFSAGVGIVFGIAPAIRASRLSPIEALRYE
jgi:putative ABC transport system permease protein